MGTDLKLDGASALGLEPCQIKGRKIVPLSFSQFTRDCYAAVVLVVKVIYCPYFSKIACIFAGSGDAGFCRSW